MAAWSLVRFRRQMSSCTPTSAARRRTSCARSPDLRSRAHAPVPMQGSANSADALRPSSPPRQGAGSHCHGTVVEQTAGGIEMVQFGCERHRHHRDLFRWPTQAVAGGGRPRLSRSPSAADDGRPVERFVDRDAQARLVPVRLSHHRHCPAVQIPPVGMSSCIELAGKGSRRGIMRMGPRGGEVLSSGY